VSFFTILRKLATYDISRVVAELSKYYKEFIRTKDQTAIPGDLLTSTFASAAREGGVKEWEELRDLFKNPATPALKKAAMWVYDSCVFVMTLT
jgi:hypothetical protein